MLASASTCENVFDIISSTFIISLPILDECSGHYMIIRFLLWKSNVVYYEPHFDLQFAYSCESSQIGLTILKEVLLTLA